MEDEISRMVIIMVTAALIGHNSEPGLILAIMSNAFIGHRRRYYNGRLAIDGLDNGAREQGSIL